MTVPGFPSMFVMYGPNTNTSGGSIIAYHEAQAAYIRQALQQVARARARPRSTCGPRSRPPATRDVQGAFAGTAWTRCDSWYRTPDGRIVANWPDYMRDYFERTRDLRPRRVRAARAGRLSVDVVTEAEIAPAARRGRRLRRRPGQRDALVREHRVGRVARRRRRWRSARRIAFVARFLGRRLAYTYEVREHVAGERFVMATAEGPFPMETTYELRDSRRRHAA